MRTLATTIVASILASGAAFAQGASATASTPFGERIEVRLVQIDAWAADSGRPVLDLRQDELRLSEDGKAVQILYFAAPVADALVTSEPGAPPSTEPAAEPQEEPSEPVTVAIFLDAAHLGVGTRSRAVDALRGWLAAGLPEGADSMLVSHERELRVLVSRTRDRARLIAALDGLEKASTIAAEAQSDERQTLERIRERQREGIERQRDMLVGRAAAEQEESEGSGGFALSPDAPCRGDLLQMAEELADRVSADAKGTLESLAAYADSLSVMRGRKILLFVSDGLPSRPGGAAYDYVRTLCDGSGARERIQYAIDVDAQGGALQGQLSASALALAGENRSLAGLVNQVVARANTSGVSVWTLSARGLTASGTDASTEVRIATGASMARQKGEAEDVMNALAIDTGGRAVLESNNFGAALSELSEDLFRAYSIAFASPRAGDGKLHQIRLETTRPGVRLRYRRSWRDSSGEEELAGLVGGALAFGVDRPGLHAVVSVGRQTGQTGQPRLVLRLVLPRSAITSMPGDKGGQRGMLRLAIALRPVGGEPTPVRTKLIPIEPAAGAEASESLVHDIALPEIGRGSLVAVGLRDEVSGEMGVFRVEVGGS